MYRVTIKKNKPSVLQASIFFSFVLFAIIDFIVSQVGVNAQTISKIETEDTQNEVRGIYQTVDLVEGKELDLGTLEREKGLGETIEKIQRKYEEVGSPIADKVPFIVKESEKRGLNPKLVLAVQAKESGWGRSEYCQVNHNCFGYGATDSGNIDYWFENGSYEEGTLKILDSFEAYYKVQTAQEMAKNGYNYYSEWVVGVNEIMSYWR